MSQPGSVDPIGSIRWTESTGGVLTKRECLALAPPLLRGELGILAGRIAMMLRIHSVLIIEGKKLELFQIYACSALTQLRLLLVLMAAH